MVRLNVASLSRKFATVAWRQMKAAVSLYSDNAV